MDYLALIFVLVLGIAALRWWLRYGVRSAGAIDRIPCRVIGQRQAGSEFPDYFVCFENVHGTRLELRLDGQAFGLLAVGDHGDLLLAGAEFRGFERRVG